MKGTVQGPSHSANRYPCCTSRASFPAFGKSAIGSTYGIETAGSCQKADSCCLLFLESRHIEPLLHASRFLRGRLSLFPGVDGFTTVYGTSGWQGLAHLAGSTPAGSLLCLYDSREKFVHFGSAQPGRAQLVRARTCRGDAVKILISRNFCVKMSGTISRPSGGSTPPKLRF